MSFKLYALVLIVLGLLDGIWLGLVAKKFYARQLSHLRAPRVKAVPAAIFYALYAFGVMIFVVQPAVFIGSLYYAFFQGALFGLVAYATYDLTNAATLKGWPTIITIVDLAWGAILTGTTSMLVVYLAQSVL
jgi:uncharacterized membrane protein